jgi:electron transfer flavoprotein alpha subunit
MPGLKRDFPYDPDAFKNVWVYIEINDGVIANVSLELLGEGRRLAEKLGSELCGVMIGDNPQVLVSEIFEYGADKTYIISGEVFARYRSHPYVEALLALMRKYHPDVVLYGATEQGRDLAGAVAADIMGGLTADCTGLDIDNETKTLISTRPAFGGNIMASIKCPMDKPQMSTVRPRVFPMPPRQEGRSGEIIIDDFAMSEDEIAAKVLDFTPASQEKVIDLSRSDIIIAGGKGVGSAGGFEKLKELAELLDGEVGASRGAVDAGYIDYSHQVGQTGQTVRPKIYFAFGISGAIQHLVGMKESDRVIAVNSDPDAPIFRNCDYGIVDDLFDVIDAMTSSFGAGMSAGWLKAAHAADGTE